VVIVDHASWRRETLWTVHFGHRSLFIQAEINIHFPLIECFLPDRQEQLIQLIRHVKHAQEYAKYEWKTYKELFPCTISLVVWLISVRDSDNFNHLGTVILLAECWLLETGPPCFVVKVKTCWITPEWTVCQLVCLIILVLHVVVCAESADMYCLQARLHKSWHRNWI